MRKRVRRVSGIYLRRALTQTFIAAWNAVESPRLQDDKSFL